MKIEEIMKLFDAEIKHMTESMDWMYSELSIFKEKARNDSFYDNVNYLDGRVTQIQMDIYALKSLKLGIELLE